MTLRNLMSPVKDPVHGYLKFNIFEQEIIDGAYFQRLHFILQNSTNYVSFPANKNSRFVHSLGVAKLSGDIFISGLASAEQGDLAAFLVACEVLLKELYQMNKLGATFWQDIEEVHREHLGNAAAFDHRPLKGDAQVLAKLDDALKAARQGSQSGPSSLLIINTFWVAMRICGLVHDIGHLPMSHSFEVALDRAKEMLDEDEAPAREAFEAGMETCKKHFQDPEHVGSQAGFLGQIAMLTGLDRELVNEYIKTQLPVHEIRGLMIFDMMLRNPTFDWSKNEQSYRHLIYQLVQIILFASSNKLLEQNIPALKGTSAFLLLSLKRIVSGEVDSDRLDYTVRDGMATGTEVGRFDLDRIVSSTVLVQRDERFVFAFQERAVSGLEQFFQQRYEGYKYLIFHRTAARSEAALHELIAEIIRAGHRYPHSDVADLLQRFGYIEISPAAKGKPAFIERLLPATTSSIVRLDDANLRTMLFELHHRLSNPDYAEDQPVGPDELQKIAVLTEIVLFRSFQHVYNPLRSQWVQGFMEKTAEDLGGDKAQATTLAAREFLVSGNELVKQMRKKARQQGISLLYSFAKPKIYSETDANPVLIRENAGETIRTLGDASQQMRNMTSKWGEDAAFRLCFASRDLKLDDVKRAACDDLTKNFLEELIFNAQVSYQEGTSKDVQHVS